MTDRNLWKTAKSVGVISEGWFKVAAECGIQAFEIADEDGYVTEWEKIPGWVKQYGVDVWSCHLPFTGTIDPATVDSAIWKNTYEEDKRRIERCGEAGVKCMVIHPSNEPFTPENREIHLQAAMEHLGILSDLCKKSGMVLAVENLPRTCLGNSADEMLRILNSNSDLRVCFDVNHLMKDSHRDFVKKVGQFIVTTHISDYDFVNEKHWFPLDGKINWREVMTALEEADYTGPFLYESSPSSGDLSEVRKNHMILNSL